MKTEAHDNGDVSFTLTPLTTSQLSGLYGVCRKTFNTWIAPFRNTIGKKIGHFYTITQVKIIFDKIGFPNETVRG